MLEAFVIVVWGGNLLAAAVVAVQLYRLKRNM